MKNLQEKEAAKVVKLALQKVQKKEYHKIIAMQAISRKKGCSCNPAGDGPAGMESLEKNIAGNIYIHISIFVYVYTYILSHVLVQKLIYSAINTYMITAFNFL
jgi:hypothetical protein